MTDQFNEMDLLLADLMTAFGKNWHSRINRCLLKEESQDQLELLSLAIFLRNQLEEVFRHIPDDKVKNFIMFRYK